MNISPLLGMSGYYKLTPADLPDDQLPRVIEVLRFLEKLKRDDGKNLKLSVYLPEATRVILSLWDRSGIPRKNNKTCQKKLGRLLDSFLLLRKRRNSEEVLRAGGFFELLNIAMCSHQTESFCGCPEERRIPQNLKPFFIDQQGQRIMYLPNI